MTKYAAYRPIDFATDETFIRWVKDGGAEGDAFWDEILKLAPGKEKEVREAMQIVRQLTFRTREAEAEKVEQIWHQIDQSTQAVSHPEAKRRKLWSGQRILMAAAAVAILLIGFFFFIQQPQIVKTAYAEQAEHTLPDGSVVFLNVDSKITYHAKAWPDSRTIHLDGEAFFEVAKGSTFEVQTEWGNVRVLGTSFNVRARNALDVACFTGQVEVDPVNSDAVKLLPGERVYKEAGAMSLQKEAFEPAEKKYWRRGELTFTAAPLNDVFDEIERSFDVQIIRDESTSQRRFTGSVTLVGADSAMDDICTPMQLKFEKEENRYTILE